MRKCKQTRKPRLTKEEKTIICKTDNFVPLVVPGLSTSSGSNSSSTSTLQDLSTSPAQERSDGLAPGNLCGSPPKTPNNNKKRDGNRDSQLFLKNLHSTGISFLLLLLLPNMLCIDRQTNKEFVEIDSEENSGSSRIELLRRLLVVLLFESVEEG